MVAYREAIHATQISRELERLLDTQQQATQELAIFRTTGQSLGQAERDLADENVNKILNKILELGIVSFGVPIETLVNCWLIA